MGVLGAVFSATMLAQTVRMAVPYACAGLGGVWSERSGVVNIALEGMLLSSGLAAVVAQHATHASVAGVAAGALTGAALGAIHALLVARGRVDAIVSGIALNLVAAGGTRVVLRALYDSSSNSPAVDGFRLGVFDGTSGSDLLGRTLVDPLTIATVVLALLTAWVLRQTRFGLRVRACGEDPAAAASVGVDVPLTRTLAVTLGGAMCGLGGVALAYDQHQFQSGMSGGRGFIALAAVIVSGWRPLRALAACAIFAALDALQIVLMDKVDLRSMGELTLHRGWLVKALLYATSYAVFTLPYAATLVVLVVLAKRRGAIGARPPAGLGKHADA